jgi:hypothetical protein
MSKSNVLRLESNFLSLLNKSHTYRVIASLIDQDKGPIVLAGMIGVEVDGLA